MGLISAKALALLLAETGPFSDFSSWKRIMRYAGLNIRMRQSGRYTGQFKISKKGRPLIRKVLGHIVLPLVKKGALYGEYYNRKKNIDKMPGEKAMTVVMRSFLKKFHCLYKSGQQFDSNRWFACRSQYLKKSA